MKWKIPYFDMILGEEEREAALSVLESNWLTTGPRIVEFEHAFTELMEEPDVQGIAVSNCTSALHLALEGLGIKSGDEVVCPSLTFVASANAIRYTGATPVFVDICSKDEWNMDPVDVETKITDKTKAIMVVHYAGYPCRMGEILEIAHKHDLVVVEDASHGPLSEWEGRKLGTIGDAGCFSFFSNKNMTTGEGGMVVTKRADLAEKVRVMRSHGMSSTTYDRFKGHAFDYDVTMLGYNYRMDEIRAAIGIEQLKKLRDFNQRRKHLVDYYRISIRSTLPNINIPFENWDGNYGYHIFPILLPQEIERNKLMVWLYENGVQTSIHYRPIHSFTDFRSFGCALSKTDSIAPRILSLPLYPTLQEAQIDYIISIIKSYLI